MTLLFISPRFPFPMLKGDQLIVFNRIRGLSKDFKIVFLTFYENDTELSHLAELEKYCEKVIAVKNTPFNIKRNLINGLLNNIDPLQVNYFHSKAFHQKLEELQEQYEFDLVHCFTLRLAEYCKKLDLPVIYELIDSMQLNLQNMVREERFFKKIIYKIELERMKVYEKRLCENERYISVVSKKDKQYIGMNHINVIPNGVDTNIFKYQSEPREGVIIFSGNMGYLPNIHAVRWFVEECLPIIQHARPNVQFRIVGANPSTYIKKLHNGKTIFVTGYVESIVDELNNAQVAVAPMRSGSGMQNKIIEAMACGTPVVTTHNGLEGLFAQNEEEILVEDTPDTFSQAVINLLSDEQLYNSFVKKSIQYSDNYHSWEHSNKMIRDIYLDALSDRFRRSEVLS